MNARKRKQVDFRIKLDHGSSLSLYFSVLFLVFNHGHSASLPTLLWGGEPNNSIQIGAPIYHAAFRGNLPIVVFKPYVGLTYRAINLAYFQSCDSDNAVGIGIQRDWYNYAHNNHFLSLGYRLGMSYGGWCYQGHGITTTASTCQGKLLLLPMGQLVLDYGYKNIGLELASLGPIFTLTAIYRFHTT